MSAQPDTSHGTDPVLALLALPALDGLSEQQVRGQACVWDGVILSAETAVDLGPRRKRRLDGEYDWFPRGCKACTGTEAYRALLDHASSCEQCIVEASRCEVGRDLWRLVRDGHRHAGLVKRLAAGVMACEPCATARMFGGQHACTGSAHSPAGQPCPCCPQGRVR